MEHVLIAQWNAELFNRLRRRAKGSDRSDARLLADVEEELISFLDQTILRNITVFFPGSTPALVSGAFVLKQKEFRVAALGRHKQDNASLHITVSEHHAPVQSRQSTIVISGFPPISGINDCLLFLPTSISANVDLLKDLITMVYTVGYDWAVDVFRQMIQRHFDRAGKLFYDAIRPHVAHLPERTRGRLLLTIYYRQVEYPLLSSDIVQGFINSIDTRVGVVARQNITEFARFFISAVKDEHSPFRQMQTTGAPVICELKSPEPTFYNQGIEFNQFMTSIYGGKVALYPIAERARLILGINLHPADLEVMSPILERVRPVLGTILDTSHRGIISSLTSLEVIKRSLERRPRTILVDSSILATQNLPDIIKICKSVAEVAVSTLG